jgi:membrane-bound serine protease (ClpP class)
LPVTATGVLLLLLAVALLVLELKITSHGVLGAGAVVSMVLGAVLLIDSPIPELRIRWSTALLVALPFAAIMAFLIGIAIRARRAPVRPQAGICVGQSVHALTACSPTGQVRLHGEIWSATASAPLAAGQEARVTGIHGLQLEVEPVLAATLPKNAAVAAGG